MFVAVKVEDEPGRDRPTITVISEDRVTVQVVHVARVGEAEVRTEFIATLPDERVYPPLIP